MSTAPCLPGSAMPFPEEHSGWWPSDRTAKSRLRAFFTRAKSENKVPQYMSTSEYLHSDLPPLSSSTEALSSQSGVTKRNRSTTWTSRTTRQSSRPIKDIAPRTITSRDPPPLLQAYLQAKLHEVLEVPTTLTDILFRTGPRRRNSISSETPSRSSLADDESINSVTKHRRNWSGASTCSLNQKLFVLLRHGFVLQYAADGLNDRLPEKILELGPQSVAFASDAIPGKHWVLRISHDRNSDPTPSHAPKASWSKFGFRQPENKRLVQDLLLVFDNALTLGTWLTAVRKEIEVLGGLEYRPDSRNEDYKQEARPVLKSQKSLPNISRSSAQLGSDHLFKKLPPSPKLLPPMPKWTASRNVSRSTTDSSIHTLNELDDLRDSSFSDARSVSTSGTSFAGSTASRSPAVESFSPSSLNYHDISLPANSTSRLSTPIQDDVGELSMYMATPRKSYTNDMLVPKPLRSRTHQGNVQGSTHPDVIDHALFVQPTETVGESSVAARPRPISTIAPLPEPGHLRKVSARHRYEAQGTTVRPNTPNTSRPPSTRSRSSSSVTLVDSPTDLSTRRTPSYSLFPRRYSSLEDPSQALSPSDIASPRSSIQRSSREVSSGSYSIPSTSEEKLESRSSLISTTSVQRRQSRLASIDTTNVIQTHSPQRSPTGTDSLIQSCFGSLANIPKRSHATQPVPALRRDSSIETTMLEVSASLEKATNGVILSSPPRKSRHIKGQKSMPSLVNSMPPCGPPPTGPLPAIPSDVPNGSVKVRRSSKMASSTTTTSRSTSPTTSKHIHTKSTPSSSTNTTSQTVVTNSPAAPVSSPNNTVTHARQSSSISSVGSVRHVTAWLASPKVAAFSAKYDFEATPKIDVDFEDMSFSSSFTNLMS